MQMDFAKPTDAVTKGLPSVWPHYDPLDRNSVTDEPIVTTRRSLLRVALVAAETAARFVREQVDADPMAWMLTPRRLFEGRAAIDGCLERVECVRAVLLHGLSIGLDADPDEIDALASDDLDDIVPVAVRGPDSADDGPRLWTSYLVVREGGGAVQAFDAVIAPNRFEAEERLLARHGVRLFDEMDISEGFDASLPLAEALVSPALADMLKQVAADPGSPLAQGLSVSVLQRFAS
jgi:hypothetical protein